MTILSPAEFFRTIREDEMSDKHQDCDYCPTKQELAVTDAVLDFAGEVFAYVMNELEGGDWRERFDHMTEKEKAALFAALADAFNDTTEE